MKISDKDYCSRCHAKDVPLIKYNTTKYISDSGDVTLHLYKMCNKCNTARLKKWRNKPGKMKLVYQVTKAWSERNKEKTRAHSLLNYHLRKCHVQKLPCAICGNKKALAHHHDYSKPLDVVWLCRTHHAEEHAKN